MFVEEFPWLAETRLAQNMLSYLRIYAIHNLGLSRSKLGLFQARAVPQISAILVCVCICMAWFCIDRLRKSPQYFHKNCVERRQILAREIIYPQSQSYVISNYIRLWYYIVLVYYIMILYSNSILHHDII